ncbi:Thy-1 membrane glycoprotein precursor, partial [Silurus meridionalis]
VGVVNSQSISSLTACLTKDQNLIMECKFGQVKNPPAICTYEVDKKVMVTTNSNKTVDATFKNRATVEVTDDKCIMTLKGFSDDVSKMYNCSIQDKTSQTPQSTKGINLEKKSTTPCSAGNTLKHGGVILLLAFFLPLFMRML